LASFHASPGLLPILATEVGDASVALEELVRDLAHAEDQPALRPGPRLVPAARRAPDELPGFADSFPAVQLAFQNVRLLDLHVLVLGQTGARRHAHHSGDERGLVVV